jgi:hypothetical protein
MFRWYSIGRWIASRLGWVTNIDHRHSCTDRSHLSGGTSCKLKREFHCLDRFHLILSSFVCLGDDHMRLLQVGHTSDLSDFQSFLSSAAILGILDDVLYLAIMSVAGIHTPSRNPDSMIRRKVV